MPNANYYYIFDVLSVLQLVFIVQVGMKVSV